MEKGNIIEDFYPAWCESENERKLYRGMTGLEEPNIFGVMGYYGYQVMRPEHSVVIKLGTT